ncbi:MAG TPA: isoamylase early set domain-containing protein [Gemmatimonadales bacterium]|nr:isoamylase early set domain-containing protein [Gemmatimonadales bacterium]
MTRDDELRPDRMLRSVIEELQRPAPAGRDLRRRVLAEIRSPRGPRIVQWLRRPLAVRLTPLGLLAEAAAIAAVIFLLRPAPATPTPAVRLTFYAPAASRVSVVGDFNDWDPRANPLHPSAHRDGIWVVELTLTPGRHEYAFLVDGDRWATDPAARDTQDDFGEPNSVLVVRGS